MHPVADSVITSSVVCPADPGAWFAVFTLPRHEKRVRQYFESKGIETFLPLHSSVRKWSNGCRVIVHQPLFPCYIFVRVAESARVRVLETAGVVSIVGNSRGPVPLAAGEIESLRAALACRAFDPHPYLTVGSKVLIARGPLAGLEGILVRRDDDLRLVVNVPAIMQGVAVHVEAEEVEVIRRGLGN